MPRPSPESFLKRIKDSERGSEQGKLRIFLGAAPGVGKTYAMLEQSKALLKQGLDIVIGIIESHGRKEIENLLTDFEMIPRQSLTYHGQTLKEFDLDAALKRHPGIILIDEMAHTNSPGLRHTKRWQDIKELLDRGIDVYTTLNVQHIESLNDDISQIIHAPIKEMVPDFMIEIANTIELVDLPTDDLLKRLREGKVYIPAQAQLAEEHFFRKGNLNALREVALRVTAERVGTEVLLYRQGLGIKHIWPTKEKILVCVGPGNESVKLIRAARRMASTLQAAWIAVYVDTPKLQASAEKRYHALQNLKVAEQLGAEAKVLVGFDIVDEIMTFAREQNITQIMILKQIRNRWRDFLFLNLADEIVRHSNEIDVYIMTGYRGKTVQTKIPRQQKNKKINWLNYLFGICVVTGATFLNFLLQPFLQINNLIMVYVVAVIIISLIGDIGACIFSSILSVLVYDYFFVPSMYTFSVSDIQYLFSFLLLIIITLIISHLTIISRRQTHIARLMEQQSSALYNLSKQLATSRGSEKLIDIGIHYIADVFDSDVKALMPVNNSLQIVAQSDHEKELDTKEKSVAQWVFDIGQIAGLGTNTLSFSNALYLPLLASSGSIGVLSIIPKRPDELLIPEKMRLLETCTSQLALALEVDNMHEETSNHLMKAKLEQVKIKLMKNISNDLAVPLKTVSQSAIDLVEKANNLDPKDLKLLGEKIYLEGGQLHRLINNLTQIASLETEIKLHQSENNIGDLIGSVLTKMNKILQQRKIHVEIPTELPLIKFDKKLMKEVLLNLIDNATKFTPSSTDISIHIHQKNHYLVISIEDEGPGIMPDEIKKLFEKFYRGRMLTSERGLGLGLAICQRIIKAHGGKIWAENLKKGGAAFRFTLPI